LHKYKYNQDDHGGYHPAIHRNTEENRIPMSAEVKPEEQPRNSKVLADPIE
jgi:hypothetical protein